MKMALLTGLLALLTGCANWTPEQHENFQKALQNYQSTVQIQQQQNYQTQQNLQQQMYLNRTTNCYTRPVYGGYNTACK